MFSRTSVHRTQLLWLAVTMLAIAALLVCGERVRQILLNTFILAFGSTIIATTIGTIVAMLLAKTNLPGSKWLLALFGILLFVPLFVHVAGWQAGFGVQGWFITPDEHGVSKPLVDGWAGAIWIHAMAAVPWVVWIVVAGLKTLPSAPEEEASLVASTWQVLWRITLPAAAPVIGVAALWCIAFAASEMSVTDFFQIRTFAEEVYTQQAGIQLLDSTEDLFPWKASVRSAGLTAGVTLLALVTMVVLVWGHKHVLAGDAAEPRGWTADLGPWRSPAWLAVTAVLMLVAALPTASLLYKAGLGSEQIDGAWQRLWSVEKMVRELSTSLQHYHREFRQSMLVGAAVATVTTALGLVGGWRLRTARRTPLLLSGLFAVMLATPGPLIGLAVIGLMNQPDGSPLVFLRYFYDETIAPWVLAQSLRIAPFTSIVLAAGFASVPARLVDAARSDGASWFGQLARVAIPLSLPVIAATWLVGFALSLGELAASILVAPPMTPTLTIQLFRHLHYGAEDRVAAISLTLLAMVAVVAAAALAMGRRQSALD